MPASLADITAMATLRSCKSIGDLALASAMIVLSDLLTLAASRWVDSRKQQLAAQALASFAREIHAHRQRVLAVNPYNQALAAAARRLDSLGATHAYADWKRLVPAWFGFRPPAVTTTAWQTAQTTGALANLPYRQLGTLYREGALNAFISVRVRDLCRVRSSTCAANATGDRQTTSCPAQRSGRGMR